jgi:hypothetical protein
VAERSAAICVVLGPKKNPQCIPANTPPVFPGLRPRSSPHLIRLVTKGNAGQAPSRQLKKPASIVLASFRLRKILAGGLAVFSEISYAAT